ncbi:MAG: hypothetical protein ACI86P_000589 [Flavobacteriales bacterium]|jgi:hypothetical protein
MDLKESLSIPYAKLLIKKRATWLKDPVKTQKKVLQRLIIKAQNTSFGKDHDFLNIIDYESFKARVPVREYEELRKYIDDMTSGKEDVLWPGKPMYLSKTSGTTSGAKYIPITKESMPFHIKSAKMALLSYIAESRSSDFVGGKMIFLQGSPTLDEKNGLSVGRLSGIVAHHVPKYLQKNRMPSFETNTIEDWEAKVEKIVEETCNEDLRLISGIPSWVQMYFERLLIHTGKKTVLEVFPNFSLFVYGGVNYEPYRSKFEKLIGKSIPSIELYPASEGFIAYQDSQKEAGMLLELNSQIFYEFIRTDEFHDKNPKRISIADVELGVNYVIILNTSAGLWGYNIGDTVKFVNLTPHRIIVSGRIKHFTSAMGEHVIAEEVEKAMKKANDTFDFSVSEFHVAPQLSPKDGLPYHEWLIEFDEMPQDIKAVTSKIDAEMCRQNPYYKDLIEGKLLRELIITSLPKGSFNKYMESQGKLGGQNKVPRLANDRKVAGYFSNQ